MVPFADDLCSPRNPSKPGPLQYGKVLSIDMKAPVRPPAFAFVEFGYVQWTTMQKQIFYSNACLLAQNAPGTLFCS